MKTEMTINRTINSYTCNALAFNVTESKTENLLLSVPVKADVEDKDSILKALRKDNETDTIKLVAVLDVIKHERLYSVPVSDFMDIAIIPYEGEKLKGRYITRTINVIAYKCIVWNRVKHEMSEHTLTVKGKPLSEPLKEIRKRYEGDTLTIADVIGETSVEQLYAAKETDFIALAERLEQEQENASK